MKHIHVRENNKLNEKNYELDEIILDYDIDYMDIYYDKVIEILDYISSLNKRTKVILNIFDYKSFNDSGIPFMKLKNIDLYIKYSDIPMIISLCDYLYVCKYFNEVINNAKKIKSSFERYVYIFDFVRKFKVYKICNDCNKNNYHLRKIIDGDYIHCLGFTNLLIFLLNMCDILAFRLSCFEDKHARVLVKIDDKKYNINSLFISDPTFASNKYFNNVINGIFFDDYQDIIENAYNDEHFLISNIKINALEFSSFMAGINKIDDGLFWRHYYAEGYLFKFLYVFDKEKYIEFKNKYYHILLNNDKLNEFYHEIYDLIKIYLNNSVSLDDLFKVLYKKIYSENDKLLDKMFYFYNKSFNHNIFLKERVILRNIR